MTLIKIILLLIFIFGGWKVRFIGLLIFGIFLFLTHWKPKFSEKAFHLYFGLPGCGKTTALCFMYLMLRKKFDIFTNVHLAGAYELQRSDFGVYDLHVEKEQSVVLYDEASIDYFKRDFAKFNRNENSFHSQHRKHHVMECFFCQSWDGIDLRLRELNSDLFYVYNRDFPIVGKVVFIRKIDKNFDIKEGQPIDGYKFVPFSTRWFLARPVFKHFNTYEVEKLKEKQWFRYE